MTEFPVTVVDAGPMVRATLLLPGCPGQHAVIGQEVIWIDLERKTRGRYVVGFGELLKGQQLVRSLSYTRRLEDMNRYLIRFVVDHSD